MRQLRHSSFVISHKAKILVFAAIILVGALFAISQIATSPQASAAPSIPYKMNFQGRLTNSAGNIMADGLYNMQFRIYDTSTAGTLLWNETRETTARIQVTNGLFSTQLGDVTSLPPAIFNSATPRYFEITLATPATATCSTAACATWESPMTPRQPMASSAYAFNADQIDGIDGSSLARNDAANTFTQANTFSGAVTISGANPFTVGTGTAMFGGAVNVSGTVSAGALVGPSLDTATATALNIGSANATSINLNQSTTLGAGKTLTIGTALNGIILSDSGVTLAGTARLNQQVSFSPEYPGATFTGDGTSNIGSLSSDFCSGSSRQNINATVCVTATNEYNYYQWTNTQATVQDYDLYVTTRLPENYSTGSMTNLTAAAIGTTITTEKVIISMYSQGSATPCVTTTNLVTANNTWAETVVASPLGACTLVAGDRVTFKIHLEAGTNNFARISDFRYFYKAKF